MSGLAVNLMLRKCTGCPWDRVNPQAVNLEKIVGYYFTRQENGVRLLILCLDLQIQMFREGTQCTMEL